MRPPSAPTRRCPRIGSGSRVPGISTSQNVAMPRALCLAAHSDGRCAGRAWVYAKTGTPTHRVLSARPPGCTDAWHAGCGAGTARRANNVQHPHHAACRRADRRPASGCCARHRADPPSPAWFGCGLCAILQCRQWRCTDHHHAESGTTHLPVAPLLGSAPASPERLWCPASKACPGRSLIGQVAQPARRVRPAVESG